VNRLALSIAIALIPPAAAYALLHWPLMSAFEFDARGERGDELIRVTVGDSQRVLVQDAAVGSIWRKYRFEQLGDPVRIRICFLNPSKPNEPARVLYIDSGIVRLHRMNVFGHVLARRDILNADSRYLGLDGQRLFETDSMPMGVVRGGITGWAGCYELYP
jgi:hypothetical protein